MYRHTKTRRDRRWDMEEGGVCHQRQGQ